MSGTEFSGVLLVDKPSGPTSFDVVRRVRTLLKVKRAGHTGTLDPLATGLLPVCVGDATRIASWLGEGEKEYRGTVRFGERTDTQDAAGKVTETRDASGLQREAVETALRGLTGVIDQQTPMYSARRVEGRHLYEIAREGGEVERGSRTVVIDEARLEEWTPPDATIFVRCSTGTYIRTIADDLGQAVGTGAHLRALRRVATGSLSVADAQPLDRLMELARTGGPAAVAPLLLSVETALQEMPGLKLDAHRAAAVAFGNPLGPADLAALRAPPFPRGRKVRLLGPDDLIVAVAESDGEGKLVLLRVLRARSGPGQKSVAPAPEPE
jgi:tRNA pseudouridine55 synthase